MQDYFEEITGQIVRPQLALAMNYHGQKIEAGELRKYSAQQLDN